ncbi:unnamed protein product [Trichobilharzia szidati]|nr:unnamed protein product [Trichobilharzia szidati]
MPQGRSKSLSFSQVNEQSGLSTLSLNQMKIDKKTKQSVYYICHVCILNRKEVSLNDEMNQQKAEDLIQKHIKKRVAHCNLFCLQDQIRLEKSKQCGSNPPRKFILYKHIKFMHLSEHVPYTFVLCTEFEKAKCKFYEVYKCKLSQDAKMLFVLIQKALSDSEYLLREELKYPKTSVGSQCSLLYYNYNSNNDHIYDSRRQCVLPLGASLPRNSITGITSNIYVEHSNELIQKRQGDFVSRNDYTSQSMELLENLNSAYKTANGNLNSDNTWQVSMTLLQTDFIKGPRINDTGPIYMFVARQIK